MRAGTPEANAAITREVLTGDGGVERDLTAINAGAAIYAGGGADTVADGVARALAAIDSGAAADVLDRFVERSNALGGGR